MFQRSLASTEPLHLQTNGDSVIGSNKISSEGAARFVGLIPVPIKLTLLTESAVHPPSHLVDT